MAKLKKDPNAPKKDKKAEAAAREAAKGERLDGQSQQTIQKYDREEQRSTAKKRKQYSDDGIRPGDFLFHYARFNLGEQGLTKPISLHIREAMWRLYDADCVRILF